MSKNVFNIKEKSLYSLPSKLEMENIENKMCDNKDYNLIFPGKRHFGGGSLQASYRRINFFISNRGNK